MISAKYLDHVKGFKRRTRTFCPARSTPLQMKSKLCNILHMSYAPSHHPRFTLHPLRFSLLALTLSFTLACSLALAQDWPEWGGGPMRNMYSPAKNLPSAIGKIEFKPGTEEIQTKGVKNLKFALKLGSQSYGNVTVAKGKIFIG